MKSLVALIFSVLTVAVYAETYVFPPVRYSEVPMSGTVYEIPSYSLSNSVVTSIPDIVYIDEPAITSVPHPGLSYTTAKPMETPIALPQPLAPFLPIQDDLQVESDAPKPIILGQVGTVDDLGGILDLPLLPAQGPVEAGTIDSKLTGETASTDLDFDSIANLAQDSSSQSASVGQLGSQTTDPLGYGALLVATIVTTLGLVIMAFIAYDYRQRWMQSMMTQNDRYLGVGFDMEPEDLYGSSVSLSEGFGLPRRSSV